MKKIFQIHLLMFLALQSNAQILSEGFEGSNFPPSGWATFIGENGIGTIYNWQSNTNFPYGGNQAAFVRYENVTNGLMAEDWLVTPALDLTNKVNCALTFQTRQRFSADYNTNYYIKISTSSQSDITTFVDLISWNETSLNTNFDVYEQKTIDLSSYDGQIIYVAFVMIQDNGDSWYIDDVNVTGNDVLSSTNFNYNNAISIYPNPAKDLLHVKSEELINKIEIHNLLGQKIEEYLINDNIALINLEYIISETYLLKIYTNSNVKEYKLVKN